MDKETKEIVSAFNQMDRLTDVQVPSLNDIRQKLKIHQEMKIAALIKELILFICVACSIFIGIILLAFETPMSIIAIQAIGFIAFPFIFRRDKKRIEKEWV